MDGIEKALLLAFCSLVGFCVGDLLYFSMALAQGDLSGAVSNFGWMIMNLFIIFLLYQEQWEFMVESIQKVIKRNKYK